MDVLNVLLTAVISIAALFLLTKLMGNKQISQMSMFDYVIGISIGSIAAEMATELERPLYPLLAMTVYAVLAFLISVMASKSLAFRKLTTGSPVLLLDGGRLYRENFNKARLDLSDFLTLCRANGFFDLSDVKTAVFEPNGTVSFLPSAEKRPLQGADVKVFPKQGEVLCSVILDGRVMQKSLQSAGFDELWLYDALKQQGYEDFSQVFLATVDGAGKLTAFPMDAPPPPEWEPF